MTKPILIELVNLNGYHLTEDKNKAERILAAVRRAGGNCPCVSQHLWSERTMCPCEYYRFGLGCHCGLYEKDDDELEIG